MNNQHLKKTLQLIRRTGDRGIIIDEESDEIFVLMGVEAYEKMLPPVEKVLANPPLPRPSRESLRQDDDNLEQLPDEGKFPSPVELNFTEDWSPKKNNVQGEESLADVPHDGEEEEKFYLEPVA